MAIFVIVKLVTTEAFNAVLIRFPDETESVCVVSSKTPVVPLVMLIVKLPFPPPIRLLTVAIEAVFNETNT